MRISDWSSDVCSSDLERVTRLALLDTRFQTDSAEEAARRRGLIELAEKGQFKGVTPRLLPLFIHGARLDDAGLTGTVMAMTERVGREAFVRQQHANMGRRDPSATLVTLRGPTLVPCGPQAALPRRTTEAARGGEGGGI